MKSENHLNNYISLYSVQSKYFASKAITNSGMFINKRRKNRKHKQIQLRNKNFDEEQL